MFGQNGSGLKLTDKTSSVVTVWSDGIVMGFDFCTLVAVSNTALCDVIPFSLVEIS
jgi:hypothetical protein